MRSVPRCRALRIKPLGGSVTGERGIGVEKIAQMPLIFSEADLDLMRRIRAVFDPDGRCNPGKIFPTPGGCVETTRTLPEAIKEAALAVGCACTERAMSSALAPSSIAMHKRAIHI